DKNVTLTKQNQSDVQGDQKNNQNVAASVQNKKDDTASTQNVQVANKATENTTTNTKVKTSDNEKSNNSNEKTQTVRIGDLQPAGTQESTFLEESKAETGDSSLSTGMTADEFQKIIHDKNDYFNYSDVASHTARKVERTIIMHKPTGDQTISQSGSIRSINMNSTMEGSPTSYINALRIATIVQNNGKATHNWVYKNSITTKSSDGGKTTVFASEADKEAYDKFMEFAQNPDIKVTLPAIDQSQLEVPGYSYTVSPADSNLGNWTFNPLTTDSVKIDVNYTKENTVTYKFEDPFNNQIGDLVSVSGEANSDHPVNLTIPSGYQLASGTLPTSVTIPDSDKTISIPVKHQLTINLSGTSSIDYAGYDWQNLVNTKELPASAYTAKFNDKNARAQLTDGDVTYDGNKNTGTHKVSLTEQGLEDLKQQLGDKFIYPDLKDVTSDAQLIINKGYKKIDLMGGDTKVFDNTSTLPDQGTFYSELGLGDDDQGKISIYNSDGTLKTIQLTSNDVEFWLNGKKVTKDQAKNVGTYDLRLTDAFIQKVKDADGNNGNNYEWTYGTHTPTGSDTYTAQYKIYQATGKAKLSGDNSKLYDGNAVTTTEVNKNGKITIDLTLPIYKQAAEPGDEPKLLRTVDLGKYTLQDGDYTWNTADGSAPTKGGSYTISLNKDKILSHLQDRLKTLAGVGTDPDSEDPDNPTPMDNVTVSAEDLAGTANYDINTSVSYQFIDNDNNNSKVGAPVVVTGLNGESKDVSLDVPAGYELVDVLPTKATFGDTNRTISINLKHKKTSVDGRDHKDNTDLYRAVTRTITVNIEGQPTQVISQKVSLYRIKTVDEALKAADKPEAEYTTYSDWSSNMSDGSTSFAAVSVPADGNGYVRSITGGTIENDKVTE
ncbi:MBG domain-containing protein, partial [uncultured Lactobacillus sp.]|uniref:MBG domain-containing protein n=1 Tax=uncultured Lactobacillus sp. TaxID=153152 RepID=UPI0026280C3F